MFPLDYLSFDVEHNILRQQEVLPYLYSGWEDRGGCGARCLAMLWGGDGGARGSIEPAVSCEVRGPHRETAGSIYRTRKMGQALRGPGHA